MNFLMGKVEVILEHAGIQSSEENIQKSVFIVSLETTAGWEGCDD